MSKQVRIFEEEFRLILDKANKDNVGVQVALSKIIKEWKEYDRDHQKQSRVS